MHRTVYEFLDIPVSWKLGFLDFDDSDSVVDAVLSLCHSISAIRDWQMPNIELISNGLARGAKADDTIPPSQTHIFWQLPHHLTEADIKFLIRFCYETAGHAAQHDYGSFPVHLVMAIAATFGATNFMVSHQCFIPGLRMIKPSCGCKSLMHRATTTFFGELRMGPTENYPDTRRKTIEFL